MIEKAKRTAHHMEELKEKFKALLGDVKSLNKDDLKELSQEYYEEIKDTLHIEEIQDSVNHGVDELEKSIRKKPLRSAAVCIGIGFLLAKIFRL
jgi:ElaB/YqjD/DUF883 family membrane-anchored ribosome-binding protein